MSPRQDCWAAKDNSGGINECHCQFTDISCRKVKLFDGDVPFDQGVHEIFDHFSRAAMH